MRIEAHGLGLGEAHARRWDYARSDAAGASTFAHAQRGCAAGGRGGCASPRRRMRILRPAPGGDGSGHEGGVSPARGGVSAPARRGAARGACPGGVPRWRRPCWAPGGAVRRRRPGPAAAAAGRTKPRTARPPRPAADLTGRWLSGACSWALRAQRRRLPPWRGLARRRWAPAPAAVTCPRSWPSCGPWWRIPTPTRSSAGAR